jgi:hypothetical protein
MRNYTCKAHIHTACNDTDREWAISGPAVCLSFDTDLCMSDWHWTITVSCILQHLQVYLWLKVLACQNIPMNFAAGGSLCQLRMLWTYKLKHIWEYFVSPLMIHFLLVWHSVNGPLEVLSMLREQWPRWWKDQLEALKMLKMRISVHYILASLLNWQNCCN